MRCRMRKHAIIQCFFWVFLALFVYNILNTDESNSQTFSWDEVKYKTSSTILPKTRGICPALERNTKPVLVVARVEADGDPSWLKILEKRYHLCIYTADKATDTDSQYLQVPENRGHESMAYLTFLIDNYANIPQAGVVFVHGNRWAWHNDAKDYDNAFLLQELNISSAIKSWGYHNLRCDWSASTCPQFVAPQRSYETTSQAALAPWDERAASDAALPHALVSIFGNGNGERALVGRVETIRSQCCAQFVVSRQSILRHTRDEYVALRQWLLDGSINNPARKKNRNSAPSNDKVAGRILSYVWHILFINQPTLHRSSSSRVKQEGIKLSFLNEQACPTADECYCKVYGRCGLVGCSIKNPGSCHGQYQLPSNFKLPDDWAATHS